MSTAANFIVHFFYRLRSLLDRINWIERQEHDVGIAAAQRENHAACLLHSNVIRMRSRLQSL